MYITKNIPLILDSTHAASKSSDGSEFIVRLSPMVSIPNEAINVEVGLLCAEVYNSFSNVTGSNNQFVFTVNHSGISATQKTVTLPNGAYSLATLQEVITRFCEADVDCPDLLFTFSFNPATRRVSIQTDPTMTAPLLTLTAVTIEFSHSNMSAIASLLGFPTSDVVYASFDAARSMEEVVGTLNATINETTTSIQIRSDLATGGIDPKGHGSTLMAAFSPRTPGALVLYEPYNVLWHECSVANGSFSSLLMQLTDSAGMALDTHGRDWKVQLEIKYLMWVSDPKDPQSQLVGAGYNAR